MGIISYGLLSLLFYLDKKITQNHILSFHVIQVKGIRAD